MDVIIGIIIALAHGATAMAVGWQDGSVDADGATLVRYVGGQCAVSDVRALPDASCYVIVWPDGHVDVGPSGDDVRLGA